LTETSGYSLWSDKPLENPELDQLERTNFAKRLADSIRTMAPSDGIVLAIYGAWGSGKSSVLNFVEHYLSEDSEQEAPIVIRFNPWWFSGREDIVLQFFGQLRRALSRLKVKAPEVMGFMTELASALSPFTGPYGAAAAQAAKALLPERTDVHKLKAKIKRALSSSDQPVIFIIDDIDRLTKEEIRELFTAIRAIADFPNICYLLAFDREVVVKALDSAQGIRGDDYLQKIVQVPVQLPLPPRKALEWMLVERLNVLFEDTPPELNDRMLWDALFTDGIRHFIKTPRDVLRLTNSVAISYRYVQSERKCAEYVGFKTLSAFCPLVYRVVEDNQDMFAEPRNQDFQDQSKREAIVRFHKMWLKEIDEKKRKRVVGLLTVMFPVLESIFKGIDLEGFDNGKA